LTNVPPEIGNLNNLQMLNLILNPIISVPPEIRAIPGIQILE